MKNAIKTAVTTAISDTTSPIEIKAGTQWSAISVQILAAASNADGVTPNFEVVAAETNQLQINTTATINLVVRQKNLPTNKADVVIDNITLTTDNEGGV